MKNVFLAAALCFSVTGAFAQTKLVSKVFSEAKSEKPNFKMAKDEIKQALSNPETENDAKTWYVAGFLENKQFETERNKQILGQKPSDEVMYSALMAAYNYFLKAAELDEMPNEKGKVKPKYIKSINQAFANDHSYFINGGAYYWDKQEYQKSYDMFHAYVEIPDLSFSKKDGYVKDSTYNMVQYYAALAASQIPNPALAVEKYKALQGTGYKENEVYQYLASEYLALNDSANFEQVLVEGVSKFPGEPYYVQTLINIYIGKGEFARAIDYLDNAIAQDPENAQFYDVKGRLLEQENKPEEAIALYNEAIAKNPEYAPAYGNIGRIYFNQAVEANDEAANIKDAREYNKAKADIVAPLFKKALPFYEKAHALNPEEREYMVALRGIYYNLDMGAEYEKIEAKMAM